MSVVSQAPDAQIEQNRVHDHVCGCEPHMAVSETEIA